MPKRRNAYRIAGRILLLTVILAWYNPLSIASGAAPNGVPSIDKARFASFIHYSEGFTDAVTITVDDPTPSPFHDFYRVVVHIVAGSVNLGDKIYYVTQDGKQFVNGTVWDLNRSPFFEILNDLPSKLPSMGPSDAPVTMVIFSDFQCPYCRSLAESVRQNVPKSFGKEVRVLFADFPLESNHPWARAAAEASHCIGDENNDAFWAFHDWIFAHQGEMAADGKNLRDKVMEFAKQKNLDAAKLTVCLDSHSTAQEVVRNQQTGFLLGVHQTPTIFIDGRKVEGALPWANLENLIHYELKRPPDISVGAKAGGE